MECPKNLDAWSGGGWGVFIAPTTKPTVGDTVRCASHITQPLGFWWFRALERWLHVAPDSPVRHRTATVQCPMRLWRLLWLLRALFTLLQTTVALIVVAPLGTLESLVTHRTVRWIIAVRPWAPDSPVRETKVLFGFFCSFLLNPNLDLFIGLC
jgi:hypothetical protein